MRILITGSSGYLGSKVVSILHSRTPSPSMREGGGEDGRLEIFGIDIKTPADPNVYKSFVKASVTDEGAMQKIFEVARPDAAVHLAFVVGALHDEKKEEEIDVKGTELFLKYCALYKVPKIVFMSSAAAYGAHPEGKMPMAESWGIRGNSSYSYSRLKEKTDRMAQKYMNDHAECAFIILRPCLFVGPNTDNSFFEVLKFPVLPQISDPEGVRDIDFQFIHEDDMAECLVACIEKNVRGIFNVAGDGTVKFSDIARIVGKRKIAIPAWFLYPVTAFLWTCRLISSPPGQLDFMRYPWLVDNSRMKRELFTPFRSSLEAFGEFALRLKKISLKRPS